jgi:hypothetical protein
MMIRMGFDGRDSGGVGSRLTAVASRESRVASNGSGRRDLAPGGCCWRLATGDWRLVVLAFLLLTAASPLSAQRGRLVTLRIHPRAGDTLYTRFEQEVEMTGTTRLGAVDTTVTMRSSMLMLSHVLVQTSDERGATVTTITDSVSLASLGMHAMVPPESERRAMQGTRVRLRIAPDGSASVLESSGELAHEMRSVIPGMPSTLPDRPVAVGATWRKEMPIPVAGQASGAPAAMLRATYRLDSLSTDGSIAFISMRGTLTRDSTAHQLSHGLRITSTGTITGAMRVDRRRGWWADSHSTIELRSILTPATDSDTPPTRVQTKITQRMWTGGKR